MRRFLVDKTVRLQCRPEALPERVTVIIGRVQKENPVYLAVKGRMFLLRQNECCNRMEVQPGDPAAIVVPWTRVEIVSVVDDKADIKAGIRYGVNGELTLADKPHTMIYPGSDIPAEYYHG